MLKGKRVLLVSDGRNDPIIADALHRTGCTVLGLVSSSQNFHTLAQAGMPDLLVISVTTPDAQLFQQIDRINRDCPCAIAVFTRRSSDHFTREAVSLGVGAYIVDGFSTSRMASILELALTRFDSLRQLHRKLDKSRVALADRKVIERAKGMLMNTRGLSEPQAYQVLRKMAMNQSVRLPDVARSVIAMEAILS